MFLRRPVRVPNTTRLYHRHQHPTNLTQYLYEFLDVVFGSDSVPI